MGYQDHLRSFPGFLIQSLRPPFGTGPKKGGEKLAWLDGLRGFAALLVYLQDFVGYSHEAVWEIQRAFGWRGDYYAVTIPGIRMSVPSMYIRTMKLDSS